MFKVIAIIPSRYGSSRFPGKPLADLCGKPVVQHVYERASELPQDVIVATDDTRIYETVLGFGGKAVMTSCNHKSGTDRIYEAYVKSGSDAEIVVNIQGDEPFTDPEQLKQLVRSFDNPDTAIATLARELKGDETALVDNPNVVKVVFNKDGKALYFSRAGIPYLRDKDTVGSRYYQHVGIYAYRAEVLKQITSLPPSMLEKAESLEQLRWLENGFNIHVSVTSHNNIGIDTPEDLERAKKYYLENLKK